MGAQGVVQGSRRAGWGLAGWYGLHTYFIYLKDSSLGFGVIWIMYV